MKQKILLTIGDPCGVGPEIAVKILSSYYSKKYSLKVIGPRKIFEYYSGKLNLYKINEDNIINISGYDKFKVTPGKVSALSGRIAGDSVRLAAELCKMKEYDAMVTLPISKEALNCGGYLFPGHTEMLKFYTHSIASFMIMCYKTLKIANATNHLPLKEVPGILNKKFIFQKIILLNNILVRDFKIYKPRIAVLSINPHNGDGGLLGKEEQNYIIPVIKDLNSEGLNVKGTFASDSYFSNITYKNFDATLSFYHDQGLTPFKMISKNKGVNYTAGLNIIRTSPDHGTALDIAGKGIADIESTMNAISLASELIKAKNL